MNRFKKEMKNDKLRKIFLSTRQQATVSGCMAQPGRVLCQRQRGFQRP
jgi:hypothetical protein